MRLRHQSLREAKVLSKSVYATERTNLNALTLTRSSISTATRRNRQIENEICWEPAIAGELLQVQDEMQKWKNCIHRADVGPCRTFNCHGLTFASRRTSIHDSSVIQMILDDDGYEQVDLKAVKAGDVATFRSEGNIDHSGIVVEVDDFKRPRILSKWAFLHEVIHFSFEGPYSDCNVTYHRIRR